MIDGGRGWARPASYSPPRPQRSLWRLGPLWGAAIVIGVGVGAGWSRIETLLTPARAAESMAEESIGERITFGTCVWGGGENCVVDGDTFYLHGEKIRIAGIDAPETHDFKCPAEKELGNRATVRLRELLSKGPITFSKIERDHDVYGRLLRNVSIDGTDIGEILIRERLARSYRGKKFPWC